MRRLAVAWIAVAALMAGCGGASDQSAKIASAIGATTCARSDYAIVSRIDNKKTPIYNCTLHGKTVCVTDEGGIARDSTVLARLLFSGNLSGGKPACLG